MILCNPIGAEILGELNRWWHDLTVGDHRLPLLNPSGILLRSEVSSDNFNR